MVDKNGNRLGRSASGLPGSGQHARGQRSGNMALRDSGLAQLNTSLEKSKRRKNNANLKDYSGAYFKHTNFERAVIATNGRAPYNNKEVEVIT